jgi:hypothetical protein
MHKEFGIRIGLSCSDNRKSKTANLKSEGSTQRAGAGGQSNTVRSEGVGVRCDKSEFDESG